MARTAVTGDEKSGVADSGQPPVKVGGVYNSTPPTFASGQRGDAQLDSRGNSKTTLVGADSATPLTANQTGDAVTGALQVAVASWVYNGATFERLRTANVFKIVAAVAITAGTGATIWTPAGGKKFRLLGYSFSTSANASLIFGDNAVGTVIFRSKLLAAADGDEQNNIGNGILSAAANNVLKLDVSATSTITGTVWGTEE